MADKIEFIEIKEGEAPPKMGDEIRFTVGEYEEMMNQFNEYVAQRLSTFPIKSSPIKCFFLPNGERVCIIPVNP